LVVLSRVAFAIDERKDESQLPGSSSLSSLPLLSLSLTHAMCVGRRRKDVGLEKAGRPVG
jgi:hypothetical protein